MSAATGADRWHRSVRRLRQDAGRWRHWRRTRPFWGGLFTLAGGLVIAALPAGGFTILRLPGLAELAPLAFGGLITALGAAMWTRPTTRTRTGLAVVALGLAAFLYANLGGYLLGTLLSILGGSLASAWHTRPDRFPNTVR